MISAMHKSAQVSSSNWLYVIVMGWIILAGLPLIPASIWFDVRKVHVDDGVIGVPPSMDVDRTINFAFRGHWTTTVMRDNGDGRYFTYCYSNGENDYQPDNALPVDVNLNWWTWPVKCDLPAGRYRLNTLWTLEIPFLPQKKVRVASNSFTIRDQ